MNNQFATQFLLQEDEFDSLRNALYDLGASEDSVQMLVAAVTKGYLKPSQATSATLADARARAIRIYGKEFKRVHILLNIPANSPSRTVTHCWQFLIYGVPVTWPLCKALLSDRFATMSKSF